MAVREIGKDIAWVKSLGFAELLRSVSTNFPSKPGNNLFEKPVGRNHRITEPWYQYLGLVCLLIAPTEEHFAQNLRKGMSRSGI